LPEAQSLGSVKEGSVDHCKTKEELKKTDATGGKGGLKKNRRRDWREGLLYHWDGGSNTCGWDAEKKGRPLYKGPCWERQKKNRTRNPLQPEKRKTHSCNHNRKKLKQIRVKWVEKRSWTNNNLSHKCNGVRGEKVHFNLQGSSK